MVTGRISRVALAGLLATTITVSAQNRDSAASHNAAAKAAAGEEFKGLVIDAVCPGGTPPAAATPRPRGTAAPPPRQQWHAEPMKVFDNFYFVGTKDHGAWAVVTSQGIIAIDALYDYAVIDEVEGGMKKLGLNPGNIKYLVVTHGHADHAGGTRYLQDKYRPKVIMGAKDWDLVAQDTRSPRPTRDVEATDGQKITLGDTTVTLFITPGHTPSTISIIVPVKDRGVPHVAVEWGGTALGNATREQAQMYVDSAVRFRDIAMKAGADVIFTNHTMFDGTNEKLAALANRKAGDPNPFVIGAEKVRRYLTVAEECGRAGVATLQASGAR